MSEQNSKLRVKHSQNKVEALRTRLESRLAKAAKSSNRQVSQTPA